MTNSKNPSTPLLRLQKVIADSGITSRRKAEELIKEGRVSVNQEVVTELGTKVDLSQDIVMVDGQVVDPQAVEKIYLILNKPRGYVTTVSDPEGRKTVMDLCSGIKQRIFPVGRLDYHSEGLLILTNDGDFANMVMHPRYEVTKVYEVKVFGMINEWLLNQLRQGVETPEGLLRPQSVRIIEQLPNKTWLEFRLTEGKNREIRRICEGHGLTIDKLRRVAIEGVSIEGISPGDFQVVTKSWLMKHLGFGPKGTKTKPVASYRSTKKTIVFKGKKRHSSAQMANDKVFQIFRKENYVETMLKRKQLREEEENATPKRPERRPGKRQHFGVKKVPTDGQGPKVDF